MLNEFNDNSKKVSLVIKIKTISMVILEPVQSQLPWILNSKSQHTKYTKTKKNFSNNKKNKSPHFCKYLRSSKCSVKNNLKLDKSNNFRLQCSSLNS